MKHLSVYRMKGAILGVARHLVFVRWLEQEEGNSIIHKSSSWTWVTPACCPWKVRAEDRSLRCQDRLHGTLWLTAVNLQYFGNTDLFQNDLVHSIWGCSWQSQVMGSVPKQRPLAIFDIINVDCNISLIVLRWRASACMLGERNSKEIKMTAALPFAPKPPVITACLCSWC